MHKYRLPMTTEGPEAWKCASIINGALNCAWIINGILRTMDVARTYFYSFCLRNIILFLLSHIAVEGLV